MSSTHVTLAKFGPVAPFASTTYRFAPGSGSHVNVTCPSPAVANKPDTTPGIAVGVADGEVEGVPM